MIKEPPDVGFDHPAVFSGVERFAEFHECAGAPASGPVADAFVEKSASQMGSRISFTACCTILSSNTGCPAVAVSCSPPSRSTAASRGGRGIAPRADALPNAADFPQVLRILRLGHSVDSRRGLAFQAAEAPLRASAGRAGARGPGSDASGPFAPLLPVRTGCLTRFVREYSFPSRECFVRVAPALFACLHASFAV